MSTVAHPGVSMEHALEAARLLGRWSLVAQRHGGGCSCCPGLGDVSMTEVEANLLKALAKEHPLLEGCADLTGFLKACVTRQSASEPAALDALFKDLGTILADLENIQRGMW